MCARRTATIGNGVVEEDDTALMDFSGLVSDRRFQETRGDAFGQMGEAITSWPSGYWSVGALMALAEAVAGTGTGGQGDAGGSD
jgi:hypothetical protein